jgi:hypothetical protein
MSTFLLLSASEILELYVLQIERSEVDQVYPTGLHSSKLEQYFHRVQVFDGILSQYSKDEAACSHERRIL